jgi:hypothetical protein
MYGLINRAIQDMVCEQFGENTWQTIKQKAEILDEQFLLLESYPDDMTHRLVKAASEVLGLPGAEIMQAFGQYWVSYTNKVGYQELMEMVGDTLPEFLNNLDDLHSRLGIHFPKAKPPSFETDEVDENVLELHYRSTRSGLAPMVVGLVEGLGDRFNTNVEVTQIQHRDAGAECDTFRIYYKPQSQIDNQPDTRE